MRADLLILVLTGTKFQVQWIPFICVTSIFHKDNKGRISNSAFELGCYLVGFIYTRVEGEPIKTAHFSCRAPPPLEDTLFEAIFV
jgi:hypothetical protein